MKHKNHESRMRDRLKQGNPEALYTKQQEYDEQVHELIKEIKSANDQLFEEQQARRDREI